MFSGVQTSEKSKLSPEKAVQSLSVHKGEMCGPAGGSSPVSLSLVIEQNEVCGAHISLKTGSDTPLMLK